MTWNTRRCNICEKLTRSRSQKTTYCDKCKPNMPLEIAAFLKNIELQKNKK